MSAGSATLEHAVQNLDAAAEDALSVVAAGERGSLPTEFASRDAAMAYLKETRSTREAEGSLHHRIDYSMERFGSGYRVKHDPVRVAQGLTHMAKDLRAYAARVTCPVLVVRSTIDSELSPETAVEIAGLWSRGQTIDVEGGYLLYVQNPAGVAQAINTFVESVSSVGTKA